MLMQSLSELSNLPPAPPVPPEELPLDYSTNMFFFGAYCILILVIMGVILKLSLKEYHERIREFYEEGKWKAKY